MTDEMTVQAQLVTPMSFHITTGSGHRIVLDASLESGGQDEGPRPVEMLLVGLAGCAGMDIIAILRKMRQDVTGYEVRIHGARAEKHPKVFTQITVEHILTGHSIQAVAVQHAIELDEKRYCAVSAMLGKTATLTHTFQLREG